MDDADWEQEIAARVRELQEQIISHLNLLIEWNKREIHAVQTPRDHHAR
jgi:hypothetical protein